MSNEDILKFPCEFPIKIMGKATTEFENFAISTLRQHVPDLAENAIAIRPSGKGNYIAITATIQATSKTQLDAIYQDLTASPLVLMAL